MKVFLSAGRVLRKAVAKINGTVCREATPVKQFLACPQEAHPHRGIPEDPSIRNCQSKDVRCGTAVDCARVTRY